MSDIKINDITYSGVDTILVKTPTGGTAVFTEGGKEPLLQEKTATENGEVTPDEGYDGLSKVTVDVPSGEYNIKSVVGDDGTQTLEIVTSGGGEEDRFIKMIKGENFEITKNDLKELTEIPDYFMYYKSLTKIQIPENITKIGSSAFNKCSKLTEINIPNSITTFGSYAFQDCAFTEFLIPESATAMGYQPFSGTNNLTKVYFYANKLSLSQAMDYSTSRKNLEFHIKSLNDYLSNNFNGQSGAINYASNGRRLYIDGVEVNKLVVPSGFEDLNGGYFENFKHIEAVKFEGNITRIKSTFTSCTGMMLYDFRNNTVVPTLNSSSSIGHKSDCKIVVPDALYDEWVTATNWSSLVNFIYKASEYVEG